MAPVGTTTTDDLLRCTGLAPERLTLAMAGRMFDDDAERSHAGLRALNAVGVRLMLSDQGTHHMSSKDLHELGIDAVGIDRRFIADVEAEDDGGRLAFELRRLDGALKDAALPNGSRAEGGLLMLRLGPIVKAQGLLLGAPHADEALDELCAAGRPAAVVSHVAALPAPIAPTEGEPLHCAAASELLAG